MTDSTELLLIMLLIVKRWYELRMSISKFEDFFRLF